MNICLNSDSTYMRKKNFKWAEPTSNVDSIIPAIVASENKWIVKSILRLYFIELLKLMLSSSPLFDSNTYSYAPVGDTQIVASSQLDNYSIE